MEYAILSTVNSSVVSVILSVDSNERFNKYFMDYVFFMSVCCMRLYVCANQITRYRGI